MAAKPPELTEVDGLYEIARAIRDLVPIIAEIKALGQVVMAARVRDMSARAMQNMAVLSVDQGGQLKLGERADQVAAFAFSYAFALETKLKKEGL